MLDGSTDEFGFNFSCFPRKKGSKYLNYEMYNLSTTDFFYHDKYLNSNTTSRLSLLRFTSSSITLSLIPYCHVYIGSNIKNISQTRGLFFALNSTSTTLNLFGYIISSTHRSPSIFTHPLNDIVHQPSAIIFFYTAINMVRRLHGPAQQYLYLHFFFFVPQSFWRRFQILFACLQILMRTFSYHQLA